MSFIIINTYYPNKKFTSNYFIKNIPGKMNSTITIEDSDIGMTKNETIKNLGTIDKSDIKVKMIVMQRLTVDDKMRTDMFYPMGSQVVEEKAAYKLYRVNKVLHGPKGVLYYTTYDSRTLCYPDPEIKVHDMVRLELATGKILNSAATEADNIVKNSGRNSMDRVGDITHRETHPGSFEMVHAKDAVDHTFTTRLLNVFLIGKGTKLWISLPKGNDRREQDELRHDEMS